MFSNHLSPELAMEHAGQRIASLVSEAERERVARRARAARRRRRLLVSPTAAGGRWSARPQPAS